MTPRDERLALEFFTLAVVRMLANAAVHRNGSGHDFYRAINRAAGMVVGFVLAKHCDEPPIIGDGAQIGGFCEERVVAIEAAMATVLKTEPLAGVPAPIAQSATLAAGQYLRKRVAQTLIDAGY